MNNCEVGYAAQPKATETLKRLTAADAVGQQASALAEYAAKVAERAEAKLGRFANEQIPVGVSDGANERQFPTYFAGMRGALNSVAQQLERLDRLLDSLEV